MNQRGSGTEDQALLWGGALLVLLALCWLGWLLLPGAAPDRQAQRHDEAAVTAAMAARADPSRVQVALPWQTDEAFAVTYPGLALRRVVQALQWRERASVPLEPGDEVLVDQGEYQLIWSERRIESEGFAEAETHLNPPLPPYRSQVFGSVPESVLEPALASARDSNGPAPQWRPIPAARIVLPENLIPVFRVQEPWLVTADAGAAPEAGDLRLRFEVLEPVVPFAALAEEARLPAAAGTAEAVHAEVLGWIARISALLLALIGLGLIRRALRRRPQPASQE